MQKISEVLIKSEKTRIQISGNLVRDRDLKTKEPLNYCALGALACEKGHLKKHNHLIGYRDIISEYGVDPDTKIKMPRGSWNGRYLDLSTAIYRLNDSYKWSFKKIGKFIEKQEKKGVIIYNDTPK